MRWLSWLCWWRPPAMCKRVIVNFTHDPTEAIEGVLWTARGAWLVLRNCEAFKANQPPVKIVGEVTIHRSHVAYLQVLP